MYIPINHKIATSTVFTSNEKLVFAYLLGFKKRVFYVSQEKLAGKFSLSRNTITKIMDRLHRFKFIYYVKVPQKKYKYVIIRNLAITRYANYKIEKMDNNISWLKEAFIKNLATKEIEEVDKILKEEITDVNQVEQIFNEIYEGRK